MCGISGCVAINIDSINADILREGALMQNHRGPDNFGETYGENFVFFHNRLSILDLTESSNQPFEDDGAILVFNGEIYNYKQLYEKYFHKSPPSSDTIALFQLLKLKGSVLLSELNGMFAFVFYDKSKNSLLCACDRLGIKPVYYYFNQKELFFSSELKTLLFFLEKTYDLKPRENISSNCVDDYFAMGHSEYQKLPFHNCVELPPGGYFNYTIGDKSVERASYFDIHRAIDRSLHKDISSLGETELVEKLDHLLNESVKAHLISDAKVGTLCSGGIDSSLITAISLKYNKNISIYHAGVEGGGGEEEYAQLVADYLGINIRYIYMNPNDYLRLLPKAIFHSDFPIYHPNDVSLYAIAKKAQDDGVKVLLCGEGADELFGGYYWHQFIAKNTRFTKVGKKISNLFTRILNKLGYFRYSDFFSETSFLNYTPGYLNYSNLNVLMSAKSNSIIRNSASWKFFGEIKKAYSNIMDSQSSKVASVISNNLGGHLSSILHRNDRMCMMASIEARVPFIENQIIDFALNLDPKYKIRGGEGKYLLKKMAEKYIPLKNIYRPKAGFPVPWGKYIENLDGDIFHNGFLSYYLKVGTEEINAWFQDDQTLKFNALSIEIWGRLFVFGETALSIQEKVGGG